ncbi:MAG: sulfur carrier protein ThiS [Epsilonproteobacteria bacterium]|nr:sulfur carrier protein ThiS [Campylobacterota bacterium]
MRVVINGKEMDIKEGMSVLELLKELKILDKTMAVAVNLEVVKKDDWDKFIVKENDRVEFLNFVGGG